MIRFLKQLMSHDNKFNYFALFFLIYTTKKNITVIDVYLRIFPFHDLTFIREKKNSVKL